MQVMGEGERMGKGRGRDACSHRSAKCASKVHSVQSQSFPGSYPRGSSGDLEENHGNQQELYTAPDGTPKTMCVLAAAQSREGTGCRHRQLNAP